MPIALSAIQSIIYFMLHCHKLKNQFSHIYLRRKRRIMSLKSRFPPSHFSALYLLRLRSHKDRELQSCCCFYFAGKISAASELLTKLGATFVKILIKYLWPGFCLFVRHSRHLLSRFLKIRISSSSPPRSSIIEFSAGVNIFPSIYDNVVNGQIT